MKITKFSFPPTLEHEYLYEDNNSDKLLVCLHGLGQNYKYMYRSMKYLNGFDLLCPNAPIALPPTYQTKLGVGFSWYDYDIKKDEYIIGMSNAINYLKEVVHSLNKTYSNIQIIGFSQGAYLAPFVANELKNITQLVLIAGRIKDEDLIEKYPYKIIQLHGKTDKYVDYENSYKSFEQYRLKNEAEFITLNMNHEINAGVVLEIEKHI
jgi:predicted esterase